MTLGRVGRVEGRVERRVERVTRAWEEKQHSESIMADSADRGLIRRARLVFVARHRANATLRLEIDDGCVEAADLNPELSGKTLDA